ncbi:TrkH family potassium uptake protein [Metaclostridioides mangenotii]|uniref:TrkH family potassium uptake protein n=1 Tax=Metaclostridioides mangenotii TaxID=1540 RepID=UPI0028ED7536|nr:TrkH family potassium uptake protein [Clostridioides mangenotii]
MNKKMIVYILGKMLGIEGLLLLLPGIVAILYREENATAFFITSIILFVFYLLFGRKKPDDTGIYAKEGFIIVAFAWVLWSVFGSLPFVISGSIPSYIDAFFETVSGFTTTGSTVLNDIESLSQGMLFWRSFTHWIGGMGVLVFVLAFIPLTDKRSIHLMRAEVPGPAVDKLVPKVRSTAKILYGIYIILSLILTILLMCGGMSFFDSLIHMFGTAGTGGFSNKSASIGYYNSVYIESVITIFMILFGINFNMFYFLLIKKFTPIFKSEEVRAYLGIIVLATVIIAFNILNIYGTHLEAFRYAVFQVASIITTTGYATADFDLWPQLSKSVILVIMIIGACAGSTGGGIKVSRLIILFKTVRQEIKHILHPKSVSIVTIDKKRVDDDTIHGVYIYFIAYVLIFVLSVILISIQNIDFPTTFSAVLTCLNNVGPGIAGAGPTQSFHDFSIFSKVVFCFDMLAGRLELFPFLIIFSPSLWRSKF